MSRLRLELEQLWGPLPKDGVTSVTGVTNPPVTPEKLNGYNSYVGYASKLVTSEKWQNRPVTEAYSLANDERLERAAILENDGGLPRDYADAFADMQDHPPEGVADARWRQAIDDAGRLMDRWGATLTLLRWTSADLFEWVPTGCCGLAWEMRGRSVFAVTNSGAVLGDDHTTQRAWFTLPPKFGN